jgi:hypothetical protein
MEEFTGDACKTVVAQVCLSVCIQLLKLHLVTVLSELGMCHGSGLCGHALHYFL